VLDVPKGGSKFIGALFIYICRSTCRVARFFTAAYIKVEGVLGSSRTCTFWLGASGSTETNVSLKATLAGLQRADQAPLPWRRELLKERSLSAQVKATLLTLYDETRFGPRRKLVATNLGSRRQIHSV
jgi:CO/xanthine dehydrogenase Mo-binding subunit